mgnify:CR=1 FL=1
MSDVEKRLAAIESRNAKVELDKAWETSLTRRLSIASLTYVTVLLFLSIIGNDNPPINALVPTGGFVLSTLALKRIRYIWQKNR